MNFSILVLIVTIIILNVRCEDEILAISCQLNKAKMHLKENYWRDINYTVSCPLTDDTILLMCKNEYGEREFNFILPITTLKNSTCFNNTCNWVYNADFRLYKCLNIINVAKPLSVQEDCLFKHTLDKCMIESEWKKTANGMCISSSSDIDFELVQLMGIFPCITAFNEKVLNFKAIQFVCCPKIKPYELYMKFASFTNGSIRGELSAYSSAKKSLRQKFKLRQKRIKDRYIMEENAIDMWLAHPKLALSIENNVKKRFRKSFMIEMNKEVDLLRELELIHENKMQKLFEESRKASMSRLEYTFQETNVDINRVATALKLELDSILSEAEDTIQFLDTIYTENLDDDGRTLELIKQNFNNLIIQSWEGVLRTIVKNNLMKGEVLRQISISELRRNSLINKFKYLNNDYIPKNSMKNQADNYVKNIISSFEHGKSLKERKLKFSLEVPKNEANSSIVFAILISLLICLIVFIAVLVAFVMCRYSGKIMFHLSNTFKKIHPRTKNVFVQVENYPFKNRYNYGNSISQSQCKTEESFMGISPLYGYQFNSIKKSTENCKNIDEEYSDTSISNINGLENPICRLLDEK